VSIILDTIVVVECIRRLLSTAPCADIAGDLVSVLKPASVLAGHNISFDRNFLIGEFQRLSAPFPELPAHNEQEGENAALP
jgi:DNA polymerase III epsilon subunit-like protein